VTAQPLVPVEEDDNSGILEQYSQGDENEEEENEGNVRNDAPLIAQRQTSARTTAVADSLITASSLTAAAAIRRATAVDDKEKDQGQTCGCKRDRESDELPTDNDLIRLQLAYDAALQEATMSERKRILASDRLHTCRMKRSYPNDKKACKSPAQHMLPSNEDDMIIADDQTHIDIQMMDDGAACEVYLSIYNRPIIYIHALDHCAKINDITETAIRNFLRYSDKKKSF
jgi:hypothetical protein